MAELRLQVPGGRLTVQMLRDLVGWAGAAGSPSLRMGDAQDWILEGVAGDPGLVPPGFRKGPTGSLQASLFGPAPSAAVPWLTTGLWLDLLAELPDPGTLDLQLIAEPSLGHFVRQGHVRLVARRASHRWDLMVRRPGSDRVVTKGSVSTGDLAETVSQIKAAWASGAGGAWEGKSAGSEAQPRVEVLEGWAPEGRQTVRFGFAPTGGRMPVERLRELTWKAAEAATLRIGLTPGRVLLFEGLSEAEAERWRQGLVGSGVVTRHSDLDHSVVAAGWGAGAEEARIEVLRYLADRDRLPPAPRVLVADQTLNRNDGVVSSPFPVLIRTADSWLYRSGDGNHAGEGTLEEVLVALARPGSPVPPIRHFAENPSTDPSAATSAPRTCPSCLTVYDPRYGDPRGAVAPGVPFEELPPAWVCPVCGAPRIEWT